MYIKEFEQWNILKQKIDKDKKEKSADIHPGEIRWVIMGVNVGSEIDGKGKSFIRPAVVINASGLNTALIIPMSTKIKDIPGYHTFHWKDKTVALCINQMKVISQKRILSRLGRISDKKLQNIKNIIKLFFNL